MVKSPCSCGIKGLLEPSTASLVSREGPERSCCSKALLNPNIRHTLPQSRLAGTGAPHRGGILPALLLRFCRRVGGKGPEPIIGGFVLSIIFFIGADAAEDETVGAEVLISHDATNNDVVWDGGEKGGDQLVELLGETVVREAKAFEGAGDDGLVDGSLGKCDQGCINAGPTRLLKEGGGFLVQRQSF